MTETGVQTAGGSATTSVFYSPAPPLLFILRLTCNNRTWESRVPASDDLTLLEHLEKLPLCSPPHNCVAGACNVCRCTVRGGGEFLRRAAFGRDYSDEDHVNTILTCIAGVDCQALAASENPIIHLEFTESHLNAALALAPAR
jgi:ferredoxin